MELTFDKRLFAWRIVGDEVEVENFRTIRVSTRNGSPGIRVACRIPFEAPFVFEADVEHILPPPTVRYLGLAIGIHPDASMRESTPTGRLFCVLPEESAYGTQVPANAAQLKYANIRSDQPIHRLRVKAWPGGANRFFIEMR